MPAFGNGLCQVYVTKNDFATFELTNPTPGSKSDWLYLIDTGLKSSDGKTAREVLLDIIKAFPGYDLESDEGFDKAIEEIATKLGNTPGIPKSKDCL
jgi:hypothetical protein